MGKPEIDFEFPFDPADGWDGFNDSGIETFSGNPFQHLGREVPQNTIDAKVSNPARIRFEVLEVETASIPGVGTLRTVMKRCQLSAVEESAKARAFFEKAIEVLGRKKIAVLQISDSNTTGVRGPCNNGTPYFALMKATGQSKKTGETATGSFGIGKFAPFTVSRLRTVFISTVFSDEQQKWHHYAQGKSILMSQTDKGKTRKGIGYWGVVENCRPIVDDLSVLPDWLQRVNSKGKYTGMAGTTLSVLGFANEKGWQQVLAANVAESFFGAISDGRLEVEIADDISINAGSITKVLSDKAIRDAIDDEKGEPDAFDNSAAYLRVLKSKESVVEQTENQHLGLCKLHILIGESLPKRVATLRNGMLITDTLSGLVRFGEMKEFAAVLECHSEKGNRLLRAMEPPRHNDFEPDRLATRAEKAQGRLALREITKWVRDMLRRHAQDPVAEETTLDEMAQYFGEEGDANDGLKGDEENPQGRVLIRARPLPKRKGPWVTETDDGDGDEEGGGGGGGGGGDSDSDSEGGKSRRGGNQPRTDVVGLQNVRGLIVGPRQRRISFTPPEGGILRLEIQDSGADTNRALQVVKASAGKVRNGGIDALKVKGGGPDDLGCRV